MFRTFSLWLSYREKSHWSDHTTNLEAFRRIDRLLEQTKRVMGAADEGEADEGGGRRTEALQYASTRLRRVCHRSDGSIQLRDRCPVRAAMEARPFRLDSFLSKSICYCPAMRLT